MRDEADTFREGITRESKHLQQVLAGALLVKIFFANSKNSDPVKSFSFVGQSVKLESRK